MIHAPLKTGEQLGQYRLVREVGAGGFGVVWEARDRLDRRIALKIPKPSVRTSLDQLREAWHQARLDQENIVRIYGVEEVQGLTLIAMEFCDGGSLRSRLETGKTDWHDALRYGQSLCRALAAAHGHGIIHGDLKPENILFNSVGTLKVSDFGLSSLVGLPPECLAGSMAYMSPERLEGVVEPRADLWALGVVLYEALSGHLPFEGDTPEATIAKIRQKQSAPIRLCEPDVPEEFAAIVSCLLGQESHSVYGTASSLLEALSRLEERCWKGAAMSFPTATSGLAETLPETTLNKLLHRRSAWRRVRDHPVALLTVTALATGGIVFATSSQQRFHLPWTTPGPGTTGTSNREQSGLPGNPSVSRAFAKQAEAAMRAGDYESATKSFHRALEQDPDNASVHFNLGLAQARLAHQAEAIANVKEAVLLAPQSTRYRRTLALLYEETARRAKAVEQWQAILKSDPENAEARDMLERLKGGVRGQGKQRSLANPK